MPSAVLDEIRVVSTLDGSAEPSLFFHPGAAEPATLLVGLHTWSADRFNQVEALMPHCQERGWALLLPEFRGANLVRNPRARQACASALAKQDVCDAVDSVCASHAIDPARILLFGGSGGGHMALMMAAYAPRRWRAVSAWVPITDLAVWHGQNANYAPHIAACCGGVPGANPGVDREYRDRSPLSYVDALLEANIAVHHGRFDPSVPYSHTWHLAEAMERAGARRFFFEIFDGGHELRHSTAFHWFDSQVRPGRKSGSAVTG